MQPSEANVVGGRWSSPMVKGRLKERHHVVESGDIDCRVAYSVEFFQGSWTLSRAGIGKFGPALHQMRASAFG